jgi:hypothetical protein
LEARGGSAGGEERHVVPHPSSLPSFLSFAPSVCSLPDLPGGHRRPVHLGCRGSLLAPGLQGTGRDARTPEPRRAPWHHVAASDPESDFVNRRGGRGPGPEQPAGREVGRGLPPLRCLPHLAPPRREPLLHRQPYVTVLSPGPSLDAAAVAS